LRASADGAGIAALTSPISPPAAKARSFRLTRLLRHRAVDCLRGAPWSGAQRSGL